MTVEVSMSENETKFRYRYITCVQLNNFLTVSMSGQISSSTAWSNRDYTREKSRITT